MINFFSPPLPARPPPAPSRLSTSPPTISHFGLSCSPSVSSLSPSEGGRLHGAGGCRGSEEARVDQGGEARPQLHDGHPAHQEGKRASPNPPTNRNRTPSPRLSMLGQPPPPWAPRDPPERPPELWSSPSVEVGGKQTLSHSRF